MTSNRKKIAALIMAAGAGERFGGVLPKQYQPLLGKPVLGWSLEAFQNHPDISEVAVVIHPDHADHFRAVSDLKPVMGGSTRQQSVRKGLEALRASKPDFVLIHDAARPLVSEGLISDICRAVAVSGAAIPALPVTDTVRRSINGTLQTEDRQGLMTVQTPQAFSFDLIDKLHAKYAEKSFTDDAALCEAEGRQVTVVPGQANNIKITHPADMMQAEQHISSHYGDVRTGQGYDVHRLVPSDGNRKLMLCGVVIPHNHMLEGHSDADVGLHAITDAVLGTIGEGDIGQHFSPKDARWKQADSSIFLRHAADMVAQKGGIITHVDATLICEEPKISPYREAMRQKIAEILKLPLHRVSVKATTTEGLGFTGRGEGIAAQALVTVRLSFASLAVEKQQELKKWA